MPWGLIRPSLQGFALQTRLFGVTTVPWQPVHTALMKSITGSANVRRPCAPIRLDNLLTSTSWLGSERKEMVPHFLVELGQLRHFLVELGQPN